jgi:hypothetical protein
MQVGGVWEGAMRAIALQRPLNRFVTVHWTSLGLRDGDAMRATSHLLTAWRDWLRDRGSVWACVWVRENDDGDGSKGSHLHVLVHVPEADRATFNRATQRMALKAADRQVGVTGAVLSRAVGSVGMETRSPASYRANLAAALAYMSKGAPLALAGHMAGLAGNLAPEAVLNFSRFSQGGLVIGKRAGWSRDLFNASRRNQKPQFHW